MTGGDITGENDCKAVTEPRGTGLSPVMKHRCVMG